MQLSITKPQTIKIDGATAEAVTITPSIATAFMEQNKENRRAVRGVVDRYARDMKRGEWRFTGEAIKFDKNKVLIDGQHRLLACIKSGVSFRSMVMYGLPPETKAVIDTGKSRSISDIMTFSGVMNSARVSSVARMLLLMKNDDWISRPTYSSQEIMAVLEKHPHIQRSCGTMPKVPRSSPAAAIQFCHYVGAHVLKKPNEAAAWYQAWHSGVPAYDGCPVHMWRERCIQQAQGIGNSQMHRSSWTTIAVWNLFAHGETVKNLKLRTNPVAFDDLPKGAL